MRKLQRPPVGKPREKKQEPLAEGLQVIPTDSRGRRLWNKVDDKKIVEFAKRVMKEKAIIGRRELEKADCGLYHILLRRGLIDEVGFEQKQRSWKDMSDGEVVEFAKIVVKGKEITERNELQKADSGLYRVLWKRGLLDEVGFKKKSKKERHWKDLSDEEIV
ncbi:MAG: hypothetical protein ABH983_01105, partial [Candidatus Micrarchaeota archaeon]